MLLNEIKHSTQDGTVLKEKKPVSYFLEDRDLYQQTLEVTAIH